MRSIVFISLISSLISLVVACGDAKAPSAPAPSATAPPALVVPPLAAAKDAGVVATAEAPRAKPKYEAIVAYLERSSFDEPTEETKALFDKLRALADPRAADALVRLLAKEPPLPPRWRTQAALALGELGDPRAVPTLAWRLTQDPLKLYDENKNPELRRDDSERVVSARLIAEILKLFPERREEIAKAAEDSVLAWIEKTPQPHANGLRALALMGTARGRTKLRAWADPREELPKEGAQRFSPAFSTAQSALRYVGVSQRFLSKPDDDAWQLLSKQLFRKPDKIDVTMEELLQNGRAVQGMSLRAFGVGASHGFAEIGDPRAAPLLIKFIEDQKQNEQARIDACFSLAWVVDDAAILNLTTKVITPADLGPKKEVIRRCFLETITRRGTVASSAALMPLLSRAAPSDVRPAAAVAIGMSGVDANVEAALVKMLDDKELHWVAAVALLLGTQSPATATKTCARLEGNPAATVDEVKVRYGEGFNVVSDRDLAEGGGLARRAANALACGSPWAQQIAGRALQGIEYDNGPHSMTRVAFRARLLKSKDANNPIIKVLGDDVLRDVLTTR